MSPSFVTIDTSPDFELASAAEPAGRKRTLLVAPPSIAAHEEKLHALYATFDRTSSDLHMLDRLAAGLGSLPPATYDLVCVITGASGQLRSEATALLGRDVLGRVVPAMRPGGRLAAQDGAGFGDLREAVLAGLVADGAGGFTKPAYADDEAVPLRFGKKNGAVNGTKLAPPPPVVKATLQGVGFVDLDDDYESGDELVPEDELLTEEERNRPAQERM